jgi:type III secretory pathway component EscR
LEGDNNTRYYHSNANGRRRRTLIVNLNQDEGLIEGQDNLKRYITDFYKKLFGNPDLNNIRFREAGMEKLNDEDCELLLKAFTMEELKKAIFEMSPNKAAGPDGFNAEFFQKN